MTPPRITPAHAKQLRSLVAQRLRFFSRLVDRMNRVGFIPDDELMAAAMTAETPCMAHAIRYRPKGRLYATTGHER
jgi:hypothetical protein